MGNQSLKEFKEHNPVFEDIPDEEFMLINGEWMCSLRAIRMLGFKFKHTGLLNLANKTEKLVREELLNGETSIHSK